MHPRVILLLWVAAVALGMNAARLGAERWLEGRNPPLPAARSAILIAPHTVIIDPPRQSDTPIATGVTLITAVRSDGSSVKRFDSLNLLAPVSSRMITFSSGLVVTTNDVREEKTVVSTTSNVHATLRDPSSGCLNSFLGTPFAPDQQALDGEDLLGYRTVRIRQPNKVSWVAPDLGCAVLKTRISHPTGQVIEQAASRVLPGEPAPDMFALPDRYRDVPRRAR